MVVKRDIKLTEGSKKARRSAARLAAVQVLYQAEHQNQDIETTLLEYNNHRLGFNMDGDLFVPADIDLLAKIVKGFKERKEDINSILSSALSSRETEKLEPLLLHIMQAGAYELMAHHDIDAGIIIADYINVAEAFFENNEKKLVNAVLDNINKSIR